MSSKNKDLEKAGVSVEKSGETASGSKDTRRSLLKKLAVGGIAGAAMPTQRSKSVVGKECVR